MTMVLAVCGALAIASRWRARRIVGAGLTLAAAGGLLGVAVVGAGVGLVALWQRARRADGSTRARRSDDLLCVEITSLCVSAGLTFRESAITAANTVRGPVGEELAGVVRRSIIGVEGRTGAPGVDAMLIEAARSARTGAPLARSLDSLATSLRRDQAMEVRERLAKLPVKLLFPLALLILPGFVLMTVGPAVLSGLSRIGI